MHWKLNDCFVIDKEVFSGKETKIRDRLRIIASMKLKDADSLEGKL